MLGGAPPGDETLTAGSLRLGDLFRVSLEYCTRLRTQPYSLNDPPVVARDESGHVSHLATTLKPRTKDVAP